MTHDNYFDFDFIDLKIGESILLDHTELNELIIKTAYDREEWNRIKTIIRTYSQRNGNNNPFNFFDNFLTSDEFSQLLMSNDFEKVKEYMLNIKSFFNAYGNNLKAVEREYQAQYNKLKEKNSNLGLKTDENSIKLNIRSLRCEIAFCLMLGVSFKHCLVIREDINAMSKSQKTIDRGDLVYNGFLFDVKCVQHRNKNLLVTKNKKDTDIDFFVLMCDQNLNTHPTAAPSEISFLGCKPKISLDWQRELVYMFQDPSGVNIEKNLGNGFYQSELLDMFNAFQELKRTKLSQTLTDYMTNSDMSNSNQGISAFLKNVNRKEFTRANKAEINRLINSELNLIKNNTMSNEYSDPNHHILGCYASEIFSSINNVTNGIKNLLKFGSYSKYYKYFYEIDDFNTFLSKCRLLSALFDRLK
jgi:hypothetical protein